MPIRSLTATALLCAISSAHSASFSFLTADGSDVSLNTSGSAVGAFTSGPETALFSGSLEGDVIFARSVPVEFSITSGSFSIAGNGYSTVGPTIDALIVADGIDFTLGAAASGGMTLAGIGTVDRDGKTFVRYTLSGDMNLAAIRGVVWGVGNLGNKIEGSEHDFATSPFNMDVTLKIGNDSEMSYIDFLRGTTDADQVVLRFDPIEIYSKTLASGSMSLTMGSLNSIELAAVPEPAHASLLMGTAAIGMMLIKRRRK